MGSQVFLWHSLCTIISNNTACGWRAGQEGQFFNSYVQYLPLQAVPFPCLPPWLNLFVCKATAVFIEAFHQLYELTAESAAWVSLTVRVEVVG